MAQRHAYTAQRHWRAHLLALDPGLLPNLHQRRLKCIRVRWHSNGSSCLKRALKTAQRRCADGTTIKHKRVTNVYDEGFPHRAERGQMYDLRYGQVADDRA